MTRVWRSSGMGRLGVLALLAGALVFTTMAVPVAAQSTTPATPAVGILQARSDARLAFPGGIEISGDVRWDVDADDVWLGLVYWIGDNETLFLASGAMTALPGSGQLDATAWLDLQAQYIPPGLEITWQWRLVSDQEVLAVSPLESTGWFDSRQDWKHLERDQVRLHYFGLDQPFAEQVLDSVSETATTLEHRFALDFTSPFELWVYPTAAPFLEALVPNSLESMVAATYPDFDVILAVVPNGDARELARVIPHEVTHLLLFQATDNPFTYLPLWFNEGMATHFQSGGTDGYLDMVIAAWERDALYSLTSIDVSFPYTAFEASLAYATSWSAVEYVLVTWGDPGIASLIDAYASGMPWEDALQAGLGVSSAELDRDWRAWIGTQAAAEAA